MNIESFNNKYWISVSGKRGTLYGYSYGLKKRDLIVNNDEIYYIEHIEYERNPRNMFRANVVMIGRSDGILKGEELERYCQSILPKRVTPEVFDPIMDIIEEEWHIILMMLFVIFFGVILIYLIIESHG